MTRGRRVFAIAAALALLAVSGEGRAGMPSPLPSDFRTLSRLTESAHGRVR